MLALKTFDQLLAPDLSYQRFQQEVDANLQTPNHERIVRLLAAFTYRERFYLLFPHANEGSLDEFWRSHSLTGIVQEPARAEDTELYTDRWLVGECFRLSDALAASHSLANERSDEARGLLHADIKPENILCFRDADSPAPAMLKLADFGEAKVIEPGVPLKSSKVARVLTYRPPERYHQNVITLNYDVWSLGCLFLDFVTWAIRGQDGIDSFSAAREDEEGDSAQVTEDIFYRRGPTSLFSTTWSMGSSKKSKVENGRLRTKHSLLVTSHAKTNPRLKDAVVSVSKN